MLGHFLWSRVAASNGTADPNVGMQEGMAPSAVNDGVRALMASAAGFRDDISGAIVTGGSGTAFTVSSYQGFDTLPHLDKMVVAFTPHTTNTGTSTLNVDSLGAKPLRSATGVELPAGTLVAGTPYTCVYNASDAAFYLHNFFGNPYSIPIGGSLEFWGTTAPNSSFAFPYGQAISRSTYSVAFGLMETTYGVGDGSTTFNLPDCRGRVVAGKDDMGGSAIGRLTTLTFSPNATTLGAVSSGSNQGEMITLTANQIPTITSAGSNSITVTATRRVVTTGTAFIQDFPSTAGSGLRAPDNTTISEFGTSSCSNTISVTSNNTGGAAHGNVQPTILANKLIRII